MLQILFDNHRNIGNERRSATFRLQLQRQIVGIFNKYVERVVQEQRVLGRLIEHGIIKQTPEEVRKGKI